MDIDDSPRSGGSTPVMDEPTYHEEDSQQEMDVNKGESDNEEADDTEFARNRESNMDDDYVSDGGEVEREEVERDMGDDDEGPASPESGPMSPEGSNPAFPAGPQSPLDGPGSPEQDEGPASPVGSYQGSGSPRGSGSPPGSPEEGPLSPPPSPASPEAQGPASPDGSGPASPDEPRSPGSPGSNRSRSPIQSPNGSPARSRSNSPDHSQRSSRSRSGSPARSQSGSPARSRSGSPRSRSGSPVRSRSGSPRSRSGSPRSRSGSPRSRSGSPRSRTGSPRSRSGSPRSRSGSPRSRSGSPKSRSGSPRSRSGSRSISRSRSRSRSRSGSRSRSRSRSRSASPRSRSASPAAGSDEEKEKEKAPGSDDENDTDKDELIADIFGSSDEDEEFEGFEEADVEAAKKKKEKKKGKESKAIVSDDEEGGGVTGAVEETQGVLPDVSSDEEINKSDMVSDFDLMLMRKKEEMRKRKKRRRDVDIINDNDDLIADMIVKMKEAAEDDRELNMQKKPAITKLKMLTHVVSQLKKADLHSAFLDCGVLSAMTEWLAPLPDKSLPHLQIREKFLRILQEFPAISQEGLKASGIGKAIMYLYKHPKESKENKERAGKLINEWSRPIFNLTSNFKMLSKQEREERDYEQLPKKRRVSAEGMTPRRDIDKALVGEDKQLRPGDKGWINRARVPMPSHKDYVVRPKWAVEEGMQGKSSGKKAPSRYDKHVRAFAEKKKFSKAQRAVTISIEGRNMAL
ncbi:protein IWS1 homolog [Saccostrea echinata]|uniref:protein IWS1 homolog n=1 Tax=Saccostrea echinata TaxID=191078 RepID=UPI002A80AFC0|nr:protein IWS1 homolog [Saccostrea echinata]